MQPDSGGTNLLAVGSAAATFRRHRRLALAEFLDTSTFHGLSHLQIGGGHKRLQLLWTAIVATAISCLGLHVYQQVSEYYKYPLQSSTREILNNFSFPSVTICEAWQMRFFRGGEHTGDSERLREFLNMTYWLFELPKAESVLQYLGNFTSFGLIVEDLLIDCKFNGSPCGPQHFTAFYHRHYGNCFTFEWPRSNDTEAHIHDGLSLILYSPSSDPFFRDRSDPEQLDSSADTGLEIDGVLVTAHEVGTVPRVSEDSIIAATSHETKIGLKEVRTSLVNTPQRPCATATTFSVFDHVTGERRRFKTTQADRLEWMEMQRVIQHCGCFSASPVGVPTHLMNRTRRLRHCADIFDAMLGRVDDYREFRSHACRRAHRTSCRRLLLRHFPSLRQNWRQFRCYQALTNDSAAQLLHADDECSSSGYQFQIFTSELPDSESASFTKGRYDARLIFQTFSSLLHRYLRLHDNSSLHLHRQPAVVRSVQARGLRPHDCAHMQRRRFANESHCSVVQEFISRHFLRVQVYPFSKSVVYIAEEMSYSVVDLLSHLGGILGLWIGSSVISLFELLEVAGVVTGSWVSFSLNSRRGRPAGLLRYPAPRR